MFGIGAQELILILVVALLVFGPKRLPELARTMGKGLAEFRRASSDLRHSLQSEIEPDPASDATTGREHPQPSPTASRDETPAQAVGTPEEARDDPERRAAGAEGAEPPEKA